MSKIAGYILATSLFLCLAAFATEVDGERTEPEDASGQPSNVDSTVVNGTVMAAFTLPLGQMTEPIEAGFEGDLGAARD